MNSNLHIGPHVPCLQRSFFVLSIIAIPLGLGAIAGGVLIIVMTTGHAAAASGAVVIFVGFCLTTFPPTISFKLFDLRLKVYEGKLRIAKSYGEFPDNLHLPRMGKSVDLGFYDMSEPTRESNTESNRGADEVPVRTSYLPQQKVVEGQTGLAEASTPFVGSKSDEQADSAGEKAGRVNLTFTSPEQQSTESGTEQHQPSVTAPISKPKRQKGDRVVRETAGVYAVSGQSSSPTTQSSNMPPRNVSSLYSSLDVNQTTGTTSRSRL